MGNFILSTILIFNTLFNILKTMQDTDLKVLEILKSNFNKFVSGEKISRSVGISRVGVYKIINKLISEGCNIKRNKKLGYKLTELPFSPYELLKQKFNIPKQVFFYKKTTSTMEVAKQLILENPNLDNFLVISEIQTSGKGRIQRKWFSPQGGLYFSVVIKPKISPQEIFLLNYIFSLSVVEVLNQHYSIEATTKWPNDIIVENKKICGILIESDIEIDKVNWCIIGTGININIEKNFFSKHYLEATSVCEILKRKIDLTEFLILLFEKINNWYNTFNNKNYDKIISEWKKFSSTIGKKVKIITFNQTIKATAIDISPKTGSLLIKTSHGIKEIHSGDCIHLR